jgi:hypothetical protein
MECDDDFLPVLAPSFLPFCAWCGLKGKFKCDLGDSYPGTAYHPGKPFEKQESIWFYCNDCDTGQHMIGVKRDREAVSPITGWMVYFHKGHFVVEKSHAFKMLGILKRKEYGERG